MRSRGSPRMRAPFRPGNRRANQRSRWKRAPMRFCIPRRRPPADPDRRRRMTRTSAADVDFARLQLIDKFKPSRPDDTRGPLRRRRASTTARRRDAGALPPPAPARTAARPSKRRPLRRGGCRPLRSPWRCRRHRRGARRERARAESPDDGSLEFTLPPGELDRVFVDPTSRTQHARGRRAGRASKSMRQPVDDNADATGSRTAGFEVAEHVRRDMLAGMAQRRLDEPAEPPPAMQLHGERRRACWRSPFSLR